MNYKSILFYLGIFSLLVSLFSIFNILYTIYFSFYINLNSYIITFASSLFIGSLFCFLGKKNSNKILLSEQIIFIILCFVLIPILISVPYYLSIYDIGFLNSYFESVSGFTTTGFSIIKNVEIIDEPLLLWRSSSQWLGGLLFLLATIGTIGSKQIKIKPSYLISGGASGRNFYNNFNVNFIKIVLIYSILTIALIFIFKIFNIRLLESFNLAFTVISSGGFFTKNYLSSIILNDIQIFVLSVALLLPIFNFFILFDIITKKFKLKNYQEDLHLATFISLSTAFFYFFINSDESFANILLSVTSSIATSGLAMYSDNNNSALFFILLTIVGGSLISTSSGFKYTRIYILLKISYQEIIRIVKPINIIDKNLFNREAIIDDQDVKIAFLVFISFILSLFILSSILTFDSLSFETSFKLSILTLTNTLNSSLYGLDGVIFFDLNNFSKMSLICFMLLGKIEIIAILFLISKFIFRE
jgi:trk system potassium uptake protein TrkH